ncbi:MAG: hypothetical protein ACE5GX_10525 [Thermoanaerobaculia bacterium]
MSRVLGKRFAWWLTVALAVSAAGLAIDVKAASGSGTGAARESPAAIDDEKIRLFKTEGARWIQSQRDRHRPRARPLAAEDRRHFEAYFPERILDQVRLRVVDRFENPEFFSVFDQVGEPYPMDLRTASGMALIDTVLITENAFRGRARRRLLFHELVHVVQYDVLGLESYMDLYVDGWERGGRRYHGIPHERQAYELARRFWAPDERVFWVEREVRTAFSSSP